MTSEATIPCLFCGEPNASVDEAWTQLDEAGPDKITIGWHPDHWPKKAEDLGDIVLYQTPKGIRGRVKEAG